MLRRQLRARTHARVSARQAVELIVKMLRRAHIVGVNELHPGLHQWFDQEVAAQIPAAVCHGSIRGDAIFWRRPQRLPSGGVRCGRVAVVGSVPIRIVVFISFYFICVYMVVHR